MPGLQLKVELDDKAFVKGIAALIELGHRPAPILRAIGAGLLAGAQRRIESGVTPSGAAFAPLNPAYAADKRGPGILRERGQSGGLLGSLTFTTGHDTITIGTNKVYGAVHQFGATIRPKNAKALVFRLGDRTVRVKSVTIPARPFLGVSAADREMAVEAVGDIMRARLTRG